MQERTFHIETFGCQMNVNDSDWLSRSLIERGFSPAPYGEAQIYILNTCSVRDKAEHKVYSLLGMIRKATKKQENVFMVVGGCVAQQEGTNFFKRFDQVRLVFGTDGLAMAPQAIERLVNNPELRLSLLDFSETFPERDAALGDTAPASAFINIMQGCNNFCTYCIVPYTRGRQKSRTSAAVLDECRALLDRGAREITLLGQNVNSFGHDSKTDATTFTELLYKVAALDGLERLRFMTPHPKDLAPELIAAFGELPNLCPRLHLPMQAGSDAVLKAMGRRYDMQRYLDIVSELRKVRPDIVLSSDIIVGFPSETEADFQCTLDAMREVNFAASYSFCYSDRPGTRASKMPVKLSLEVKTERLARLQNLQDELTAAALQDLVGRKSNVLLEGITSEGARVATPENPISPSIIPHTDTHETWHGRDIYGFPVLISLPRGMQANQIVPMTISEAKRHSLVGTQAGEPW